MTIGFACGGAVLGYLAFMFCGILATAAGLLTEHRFAPFVADGSLRYFLLHAFDLRPLTLISIAVGGLIGFWVPFRRRIAAPSR